MSNLIQKTLIFYRQITHIVRSDNVIANYFSRNFIDDQEKEEDTTVTDVIIQSKQQMSADQGATLLPKNHATSQKQDSRQLTKSKQKQSSTLCSI